MSYRARFDLLKRDLVNHSFSVYRDLHCWELSLNWTPNGIGQGINFKLNVKSPTLRDLKIEKGEEYIQEQDFKTLIVQNIMLNQILIRNSIVL